MQIFFDLEGPLSPQDNAYEVLGLAKNGQEIFEVISKYDDVLTLEGRPNYEPGDTLKLIVPFLIFHKISEEDVKKISQRAKIVSGTKETISSLKKSGWQVHIISTSYQQHAYNIAAQVGVEKDRVACTKMALNKYLSDLKGEDLGFIEEIEKRILNEFYRSENQEEAVKVLDEFFFKKIPSTKLGRIFNEVKVVGGQRKVEAMINFMNAPDFSNIMAVGDSITDYKMLKKVRDEGGLAVVFNGNEYCVPYANVAIATEDQRFLLPIVKAFNEGGIKNAIKFTKALEVSNPEAVLSHLPTGTFGDPRKVTPPRYHCLDDASEEKLKEVIKLHKNYRMLVRGKAGKLG